MKSCLMLILLAAHAGAALAQYKCTAGNGAVTFQQTPCSGAGSGERLVIVPNGHPPPASGVAAAVTPQASAPASASSLDKRMLANYERQHQRDPLAQALRSARDDAARRVARHSADIAAAQRQFGSDPPDSQTLSNALADLESRFRAMAVVDDDRVRAAQVALDDWDKLQVTSAASAPN